MRSHVVLDTGPLVALLNRGDRYHLWAREQWARAAPPFLTCEAVLAEACFLLRSLKGGPAAVLDLARRGILDLSYRPGDEAGALAQLMKRYRDVPMSLADACLVRIVERHPTGVVLTLGRAFAAYRKNGRRPIPVLEPEREAA